MILSADGDDLDISPIESREVSPVTNRQPVTPSNRDPISNLNQSFSHSKTGDNQSFSRSKTGDTIGNRDKTGDAIKISDVIKGSVKNAGSPSPFDGFSDDDSMFNESIIQSSQAIEEALFDKSNNKFVSPANVNDALSKAGIGKKIVPRNIDKMLLNQEKGEEKKQIDGKARTIVHSNKKSCNDDIVYLVEPNKVFRVNLAESSPSVNLAVCSSSAASKVDGGFSDGKKGSEFPMKPPAPGQPKKTSKGVI